MQDPSALEYVSTLKLMWMPIELAASEHQKPTLETNESNARNMIEIYIFFYSVADDRVNYGNVYVAATETMHAHLKATCCCEVHIPK